MALSGAQVKAAAQALLDARARRVRLPDLPAGLRPQTTADAEAICEAMGVGFEHPVGGWKVGCTDPVVAIKVGLERPFLGRIPALYVYQSGASVPWSDLLRPVVEAEIGFRFGRDLPPRAAPYSAEEVADAIDALVPGIEIPESRLTDDHPLGALGMVADQGYAGRFVCGTPVMRWRELDLSGQPVVLSVGGREVARGTGARAMGNPFEAVVWLANERSRIGDGVLAGQVVSTGSLTGIQWTRPGDLAVADYGALGRVEVRLAP
jgi:2-keto-4-pentenoate hydratase